MKVFFTPEAMRKMRLYTLGCEAEISGLGRVRMLPTGSVLVDDVKIFKQTVSPVETKLSADALGKFYNDLVKDGEDMGTWKLWWHSHADMEVFWSKTDSDTIDDFDNESDTNNWMLSVVNNHKGDILSRIDIYSPFRCTMDKLVTEVKFDDDDLVKAINEEIDQKVTIEFPLPAVKNFKQLDAFGKASTDFNKFPKYPGDPKFDWSNKGKKKVENTKEIEEDEEQALEDIVGNRYGNSVHNIPLDDDLVDDADVSYIPGFMKDVN